MSSVTWKGIWLCNLTPQNWASVSKKIPALSEAFRKPSHHFSIHPLTTFLTVIITVFFFSTLAEHPQNLDGSSSNEFGFCTHGFRFRFVWGFGFSDLMPCCVSFPASTFPFTFYLRFLTQLTLNNQPALYFFFLWVSETFPHLLL